MSENRTAFDVKQASALLAERVGVKTQDLPANYFSDARAIVTQLAGLIAERHAWMLTESMPEMLKELRARGKEVQNFDIREKDDPSRGVNLGFDSHEMGFVVSKRGERRILDSARYDYVGGRWEGRQVD